MQPAAVTTTVCFVWVYTSVRVAVYNCEGALSVCVYWKDVPTLVVLIWHGICL